MSDACSDAVPSSGCDGRAAAGGRAPRGAASTRPMRRIASRPSSGRLPCAARPRVSTRDPLKSLVRHRDIEAGRLGDDGGVGAPAATSASAPRLACSSSTTAATMSRPRARPPALGDPARGTDHRGHAALHVLRAAAVEPAVANLGVERPVMPAHADGVGVAAEHQRAAGRAALEHADDVGPARRDLRDLDAQADRRELLGNPARDRRPRRARRHERRVHRVDRDEIAQQAIARSVDGRDSARSRH